jgi:hypothetical protein
MEFRNIAITRYNGTTARSAARGRGKRLSAPVITVRMMPLDPSSTCRNFSVLLNGTS